jgi:hypothetical protein
MSLRRTEDACLRLLPLALALSLKARKLLEDWRPLGSNQVLFHALRRSRGSGGDHARDGRVVAVGGRRGELGHGAGHRGHAGAEHAPRHAGGRARAHRPDARHEEVQPVHDARLGHRVHRLRPLRAHHERRGRSSGARPGPDAEASARPRGQSARVGALRRQPRHQGSPPGADLAFQRDRGWRGYRCLRGAKGDGSGGRGVVLVEEQLGVLDGALLSFVTFSHHMPHP